MLEVLDIGLDDCACFQLLHLFNVSVYKSVPLTLKRLTHDLLKCSHLAVVKLAVLVKLVG